MSKNDLIAVISSTLRRANTTSLDISFNELLDMSESGELNISPDYQRLFRWTEGQRSRFIESLLLEMPVPPIYVIEQEENTYQLIDGLQRISSYLHLRGKLRAPHLDPSVTLGDMLLLSDCDIVKELNGLTFNDLPTALQIRLKRAFIRMEVIKKETDHHFKYHMFKRLNTGGEILSPQQVRNATIRMLGAKFPEFIIRMAENSAFKDTMAYLTQERRLSAFDQELVVRFFALKNNLSGFKHDVSEYLTEYMESVADPDKKAEFFYEPEQICFEKTFDVLNRALGELAFAFANKAKSDLSGGFSTYHYEAITIGLQSIIDKIDPTDEIAITKIAKTLREVKLNQQFITITTGGGKNSPGLLKKRIGFVSEALENAFS